jgi:exodeoxyribonuclease VII small subunit
MTEKQPTFEQHLDEVERAIRKLESGEIALEDSIDLYAVAMAHLKACHGVLDSAEKRLEIVRMSVEGSTPAAGPADVDDDGVKPR